MTEQLRISFIGGGNMATALIGGMLERGFDAACIQAVDLSAERCKALAGRFGIRTTSEVDSQVLSCEVLMLAVKPQQMRAVLEQLAGRLDHQLVVSVAAGVRIGDMQRWLGGHKAVVRAMPNTPALVGAGMSGLCAAEGVVEAQREAATAVLSAVGEVLWVADERQMDSLTALAGSGPAYLFHFIEAMEAAARAEGFDETAARRLALKTVSGAAQLAVKSGDSPAELREKVTSKGGTTAAALAVLEEAGFVDTIGRAVAAARGHAQTLGEELGRS